jgi:choline dehydrogenase-like flavoprotein
MITDFRDFEDGKVVESDVCVIGAGAAGIAIARELAGTRQSVTVLESGGFDPDAETLDLYRGTNIGRSYFELEDCRLRYFGGTTGHWGGYCGPFQPFEFERQDWIADSGWPITGRELDPYYLRARDYVKIGPLVFDQRVWQLLDSESIIFDADRLLTSFTQMSRPVRFGDDFRTDLAHADNVQVLLHANVVNIQTNAAATKVDHVEFRTLQGKTGTAKARSYVLAGGGIENPRLMLASDRVEPHGLGNRHDLVGRYFSDHLTSNIGEIRSDGARAVLDVFLRQYSIATRRPYRLRPMASRRLRTAEKIGPALIQIIYSADQPSGIPELRYLGRELLLNGRWPRRDLGAAIWRIVRDLDDTSFEIYRHFFHGKTPITDPNALTIECAVGSAPNRESRVDLGSEKDALGMRRVRVDWRLRDIDKHTARIMADTIALEIGRLGLGRVRLADWLRDPGLDFGEDTRGSWHHMGTTRMSADPKSGVVDGDCKVHDIENFYVAGSSVFPTYDAINPTFTIVALAIRLADHLKAKRD